nr:PREDICTED: transmembrane protein 151 homolog isoform X2 [Bemisia tabaci]
MLKSEWAKHDVKEVLEEAGLMPDILDQASLFESKVIQYSQSHQEPMNIFRWKAVCYHYVGRKRQVTRYQNRDSYTATQVYYERVNSHAAGSSFVYTFCEVKDISKRIVLNQAKRPITKIRFSKDL